MAYNCSSAGYNETCHGCKTNVTRKPGCPLTFTEFVGFFYIHTIICAVGFFLNCINCVIFCRRKQFEGAAYRFMTVLSVFDALTLLLNLPRGLIRCGSFMNCSSPQYKLFQFCITHFEAYAGLFLHNMTEGISAWLTCFLSIERYLAIKYHYIVKAYFSPPNVHKMLAIIVGVGFIFHMPMFFVQVINERYSCQKRRNISRFELTSFGASTFYQSYSWVRATLVMFGPLLFLCIVNALLIHLVRRQSRLHSAKGQSAGGGVVTVTAATASRSDKRARAQRKLTILLVVIICLFLCGQIPLAFAYYKILSQLTPSYCRRRCCYAPRIYSMVAQNCSQLSYAVNFFVYVGLNRHFRKALCELCCVVCTAGRRGQANSGRLERPNGSYRSVPMTTMAINENNSRAVLLGSSEEDEKRCVLKAARESEEPDGVKVVVLTVTSSDSASQLDGDLPDAHDSEMCPNDEEGVQRADITAV